MRVTCVSAAYHLRVTYMSLACHLRVTFIVTHVSQASQPVTCKVFLKLCHVYVAHASLAISCLSPLNIGLTPRFLVVPVRKPRLALVSYQFARHHAFSILRSEVMALNSTGFAPLLNAHWCMMQSRPSKKFARVRRHCSLTFF